MDWQHLLPAMVLVMVRISGLMAFAPVFSSQAIPLRVKAIFSFAVALLLAPVVSRLPMADASLDVISVLGEVGAGIVFGLSLSLLNELLMFSGQVVGMQFSFSLANLLDPNSQVQTPLLGQMFSLLGSLVLLAAGLHRVLLASVMRSFAWAPVGTVALGARTGSAIVVMAGGIFLAALQLAAPVIAATMLVEVSVALMGRLSPQLPVMALTVPLKTLTGYIVLIGSLALWPRFLELRFAGLLNSAELLLRHTAGQG